jgi:hypothetical protein
MQPYPGINGSTIVISTTPGASGSSSGVVTVDNSGPYGTFPKNILSFAGDPRSSGNLNAGPQANKDALVWLTYRALDIVNGGSYDWTSTVTLSNSFNFNGGLIAFGKAGTTTTVEFGANAQLQFDNGAGANWLSGSGETFSAGAVLSVVGALNIYGTENIETGGTLNVLNGGTVFVLNGGTIDVESLGNFTLEAGSAFNVETPTLHIGGTAYSQLRDVALTSITVTAGGSGGHAVADADNTFDPTQADMIEYDATAITGNRVWTLSHPGGPATMLFYPSTSGGTIPSGHSLTINDASTGNLITMGSTTNQIAFRIYYSARLSKWIGPATFSGGFAA